MQSHEIHGIVEKQRAYFQTGATLQVSARMEALRRLKEAILEMEEEITQALYEDLGKSAQESYMCEIGMVLDEIGHMLKHTPKYARERKVPTPLAQFLAHSFVKPMPYGNVLIMSPWNYPFLLTIDPLVDALAAGNTAVVKPSAYSPATSAVMEKLIHKCFPSEYVEVITGGRAENQCLFEEKFDYIFFTGSQTVGKEVMRHAAEHLTPMTLELGGKSPCIVDDTAKIELAAKRIVFGKFLNCGQTCVAPDYILCQAKVKDALLAALQKEITCQFGEKPLENPAYGKIINDKQFRRLQGLMNAEKTVCGGQCDEAALRIAPTILDNVTWEDAVMQEEIFGPILPILTFETLDEVIQVVNSHQHPLAFYFFSEDKKAVRKMLGRCIFGGGCVNDTIIHLATSHMGFGGVGESGMGSYHGKVGFDTFSHKKSIVNKATCMDLPMRYQPYTKRNEKMIRCFLK